MEGAEALGKSTKILEETVPRGLKDGESRTSEYVREWLERAHDAHHAHELLKGLEGNQDKHDDDQRMLRPIDKTLTRGGAAIEQPARRPLRSCGIA